MRINIIKGSLPEKDVVKRWDDFVVSHRHGNIFQGPAYYQLCLNTPGYEPVAVIAVEGESVCGVMLGVIIKENGFLGYFSGRAISWGGPVADDQDTGQMLVGEYDRVIKGKVIYSQIRMVGDKVEDNLHIWKGYRKETHLDIINDLSQGEEEMLNNVHRERRRNLGRAKTKGVTVSLTEEPADINEAVVLILNLYRKIGLPAPPAELLLNGRQILGDKLRVFIARVEDRIAGARFVLCYRDMVYDWYAGSDPDYQNRYINDIMPWEVMLWASRNNFRIFDFGGAGRPDEKYGVRDFKLRYGGNLIESPRLLKIHRPLLMFAGEKGITFYKRLKRVLR